MGVVYLGFDPLLKRRIAVKTVLPGAATADQPWDVLLKRLTREAQAAASLSHPNIMDVYDIVAEPDRFSIVMEFIDGRPLSEAVPAGAPVAPDFAIGVLKGCAAALDHAHSRGIVHRDVKPANIMLDASGVAKITDFGIAKFINATTELTRGFAVGTLEYMSPEQLNAQAIDGRSDQFSLAAVAYRLLTGARIYDADSVGVWCAMLMMQRPVPASVRNPRLPRAVDSVVDRGMALAPEKRFASCAELVGSLDVALYSHTVAALERGPSTIAPEMVPSAHAATNPYLHGPPPSPGGNKVAIGLLIGLAALLAGAAALFVAERPSSDQGRSPELTAPGTESPPKTVSPANPAPQRKEARTEAVRLPPPDKPAEPEAPQRITVGEQLQSVKLIRKVEPIYPPLAKQARVQGTIRFRAIIGKDGIVKSLGIISGHPLLVSAAQEAVKQWVYTPTLLNGEPVEVITEIDVRFTLTQ